MFWIEAKNWLSTIFDLDHDALHIYAALIIQLLSARLMRLPLSDWRPIVPVVILELINEGLDLTFEKWPGPQRDWQWHDAVHDGINTMILPIVLLLIVRRVRARPPAV